MFRVEKLINDSISKHRDFEHKTFVDHELDNGGYTELDTTPVKVKYNPISENSFTPSEKYYFVDMFLHTGMKYTFLVSAEADESRPNKVRIRNEINKTVTTRIEGGRDWFNYVDLDDELTLRHPRVQERLERGDTQENPNLRRNAPVRAFWDEFEEE